MPKLNACKVAVGAAAIAAWLSCEPAQAATWIRADVWADGESGEARERAVLGKELYDAGVLVAPLTAPYRSRGEQVAGEKGDCDVALDGSRSVSWRYVTGRFARSGGNELYLVVIAGLRVYSTREASGQPGANGYYTPLRAAFAVPEEPASNERRAPLPSATSQGADGGPRPGAAQTAKIDGWPGHAFLWLKVTPPSESKGSAAVVVELEAGQCGLRRAQTPAPGLP